VKTEDLILLGVVAMGVFVVMPALLKRRTAPAGIVSNTYGAQEVMVSGNTNGWRYFTDGTSIDPNGRYYKGSELMYDPLGMYQ
jgi:hypothetical protein